MKINKVMTIKSVLSLAIVISIASCSKNSGSSNKSSATGWEINDKKGGFQLNTKFKNQTAGPGLVLVEGGTFTMGKVEDDVMHDFNNTSSQQHVQSFYMDETEVTNAMYAEYLFWIKKVFPPSDEKYKNIYEGAVLDTLVWRNRLGYNETMTNNYLRHPAYANYPVVGVNWIQATEFAKWRTDRYNEANLEKEGFIARDAKVTKVGPEATFSTETYLDAPSKTFGGDEKIILKGRNGKAKATTTKGTKNEPGQTIEPKNIYADRSSGLISPEYRLPTEAEWEYAAAADVGSREYNNYKGQKKYPWKGQYTRSEKRRTRGDQLANFKQGKGDYGGIAGWSDDGADITNRVKSYAPNDFGLYDMAGNVAEWVADVYRPIIDDEANDFNYFRGNVYTKKKIGKDGKVVLTTGDSLKYDTVSNGRIFARTLPGEIAKVPVDDKETFLRTNFSKSDNINYHDGDKESTRYFKFGNADQANNTKVENGKEMYDSPKHSITKDSLGKIIKNYDKSNKRTSLVNDKSRVFKGGSWRDRAYWLNPAQRRFFPEDMATDYIGFRCAMSRVGLKSDKKKTPRPN